MISVDILEICGIVISIKCGRKGFDSRLRSLEACRGWSSGLLKRRPKNK